LNPGTSARTTTSSSRSTTSTLGANAGVKVETVDATGAGDCFCGATLARLAAGDALFEAARYANAAAALKTTGYGAVAPLPRADAVRRLLRG
jgi:2-dehydro-3-deoxygluconokinase